MRAPRDDAVGTGVVNNRSFTALLAGSSGLLTVFLLLPLVAIFLRISPDRLVVSLTSEIAVDALVVSIRTSAIAHLLIVLLGTPAAYMIATRSFRGRRALTAALDLPLVLPPAVAGIALLAAFGRRGLLGGMLERTGISIPFTDAAVVVAILFVASPFYIRTATAAFAAVDPDLLAASRTLGASPMRTFARIALPLAGGGLAAGSALAWARGLGEFGATIMFAGSIQGETQTLPLAIYAQLDQDPEIAFALAALLVLSSGLVIVLVRSVPSWRSLTSISPFPFGPSRST